MDRLLTKRVERTAAVRLAADPITGFGAPRQKTGPRVCGPCAKALVLHAILIVACALMWGVALAEPVAAQGVREPVVPGIRPQPRPVPTPRITPRQPFAPAPRVAPGPRVPGGGANPNLVRPQVQGRDCYARCGSQCQAMSCGGLDVSQCNSARQKCRMNCRSSCR